ncbi:MAG: endonuclease/exonuclease/phosphatase family protein [Parafilimonas sp.]|nr:endonuclease/exonuclease/phosphatase family protein [Parafilimonas sp.]
MANVLRRVIKKIFLLLTIVVCIMYLLTLLAPYLNPQHWWLVGFLGLTFPYLFFSLVFIFFFWLIAKPKLALLPLIVLLFGIKQIGVTFAAHFSSNDLTKKPDSTFRLISWNVANMYGLSNNKEIKQHNRTELAQSILDLNPDIICLQEFNHSYTQGEGADNIGLFTGQFPNFFYSKDFNKENGFYTSGSIVFSKYPIIDSGKVDYPGNFTGSLIYVDIKINDDTLRIFTTHLQSFGFNNEDYAEMNKIKQRDEQSIEASRNIFIKMKAAFSNRGNQADIVHAQTDSVLHRSIVCGDFNDVPTSYTYFRIRGKRQDAFLQNGLGVGKTYNSLAPMLRIDYILPDTSFTIKQFDMIDENLSDHAMLVSDLKLK